MKKFLFATLLSATSAFVSAATLIPAPAFTIGKAGSPLGAYPTVPGWSNTGNKTLGYDTVDNFSNSLWMAQTRSVSTGSVSNLGWATARTGYMAVVPATGCAKQTVSGSFVFRGNDPYATFPGGVSTPSSGLNVAFGTMANSIMWSNPEQVQKFSYNTAQIPGNYYLYLSTIKGLKQLNGVRAGIEVLDVQVTCM